MSQRIKSPRTIRRAFARKDIKESRKASRQPEWNHPRNSTATDAQIQANRENSAHSTGPTSDEGKAAVSQNRRIHGLNCKPETFTVLLCESQADFDNLLNTLLDEQNPQDTLEHLLVNSMAQHHWLAQRASRLQETCFDSATGQIVDEKHFALYLRYATTHQRAFHKCLADLLKLRKEKVKQQIGFDSETRAKQKHELIIQALEFDNFIREQEVATAQLNLSKASSEAFLAEHASQQVLATQTTA